MGGDHKCPVCQATFTRPQHVARHMRSHTGDRPYKCQFCGDQFARSDLLARHINKCHANEKPAPSHSAGRRKGSAAASRATTSKQACDQCVQSSLPCDGSNPCSKCVSRQYRCTYVKFHRQTAPSGPGHHLPRAPSLGPTRLPHFDDFILAPPPSAPPLGAAFPGPDQVFSTPFTFNPAAPAYNPSWSTADVPQLPFTMPSDAEKYRPQTDLFRRTAPPASSLMLPSIYAPQQQQQQSPSSSWYPAWGESGSYPPMDDTKPFEGIARTHSLTSSEPASFAPGFYDAGPIGSAYRPRRVSLDFSDSSSATSHSVPSSASSSSLQLPLSGSDVYDSHSEDAHIQPRTASFDGASEPPPPREGFSSAFGLMSIDDPNALAHLSSDGVPFFSNLGVGVLPHSPNATPMPTRVHHSHLNQHRERGMSLGALPTPGLTKEGTETRELKDMWKTYMRSPLGGSGTATLELSTQMPQSPSGRRRMRVSSLPNVTPTIEKGHPLMMNGHGQDAGNPDDLRSYEAAVNARSASLKLNLVPRRRGTRPLHQSPPPMEGAGVAGTCSSPLSAVTASGIGQADLQLGISRPSSSSSSSSLAQAFTVPCPPMHSHHLIKPPPLQGASISLPIVPSVPLSGYGHSHSVGYGSSTSLTFEPGSRASSVTSDGTGTGGSGSDGEVFRPSFKRYPSQTLAPPSSKRALVERRGAAKVKVKVDRVDDREEEEREEVGELHREERSVGMLNGSPGSRPIAALPERAKRR